MNQPPDNYQQPKATDMLQSLSWVFLLAVYTLGVFWAMIVKKPGTVGVRAYALDMGCGFLLLLALSQNPWPLDQYFFVGSLILMCVLYLWHLSCTMRNHGMGGAHVHTKCIGASRFRGEGKWPETYEVFSGILIGGVFAFCGLQPFGFFIFASACANGLRDAMIDERDRLRAVQMGDAMWESEYYMNNFNKWQRGGGRG